MNTLDVTTMSSKGQVVIPTDIRKELGLLTGVKLMVLTDGANLLLLSDRPISSGVQFATELTATSMPTPSRCLHLLSLRRTEIRCAGE